MTRVGADPFTHLLDQVSPSTPMSVDFSLGHVGSAGPAALGQGGERLHPWLVFSGPFRIQVPSTEHLCLWAGSPFH